MPRTRADLIDETLQLLNVCGPGETPSAEDRAVVDARIDGKFSELERRRILYIPDADQIDDEYFDTLVALMAELCGPSFGQPRNTQARLSLEDTLREMTGDPWPDGATVRAEYF